MNTLLNSKAERQNYKKTEKNSRSNQRQKNPAEQVKSRGQWGGQGKAGYGK